MLRFHIHSQLISSFNHSYTQYRVKNERMSEKLTFKHFPHNNNNSQHEGVKISNHFEWSMEEIIVVGEKKEFFYAKLNIHNCSPSVMCVFVETQRESGGKKRMYRKREK